MSITTTLANNAKKTFQPEIAGRLGLAVVGAIISIGVPSILKKDGPFGAFIGWATSVIVGALAGMPEIAVGGTLHTTVHALYVYGEPKIIEWTGVPFYSWQNENAQVAAARNILNEAEASGTDAVNGVIGGVSDMVPYRMLNGQNADAYPANQNFAAQNKPTGVADNLTVNPQPLSSNMSVGAGATGLVVRRPRRD